MTDESQNFIDTIDSSEADGFDPLDDDFDIDEDDLGEGEAWLPGYETTAKIAAEAAPKPEIVLPEDTRTDYEKTASIISKMNTQGKVLFAVLQFCVEKRTIAEVNDLITDMQRYNASVLSPANVTNLLVKSGGLVRINEEGDAYSEADEGKAQIIEVDGVEYMEAGEAAQSYWLTSDAGMDVIADYQPLAKMREIIESEPQYHPIYKTLLTMCSAEGGATAKQLADAVDNDPLLKHPRLYAPRFMNKLEKCDAVEWRDAWFITDIGTIILGENLGGIVEEPETEQATEGEEE